MRRKHAWLILAFLFILMPLAACGDSGKNGDEPDGKPEPKPEETAGSLEEYFPFRADTLYRYKGEGNEFASYTLFTDYILDTEIQFRKDNGGTVLAEVLKLAEGRLTRTYQRGEAYFREDYLRNPGLRTGAGTEILLLREPLKKGESWDQGDGVIREILGIREKVEAAGKTYEALAVTSLMKDEAGAESRITEYYAKGIGLIRTVFESPGGDRITSTLEEVVTGAPLKLPVQYHYPRLEPGDYHVKATEAVFHTNDITRKVLEAGYKAGYTQEVRDAGAGQVLSPGTKVNVLFLQGGERVRLDLSGEFLREMNAGSGYEAMLLQALARTFGGWYGVKSVVLTIDGDNYSSGHIYFEDEEAIVIP